MLRVLHLRYRVAISQQSNSRTRLCYKLRFPSRSVYLARYTCATKLRVLHVDFKVASEEPQLRNCALRALHLRCRVKPVGNDKSKQNNRACV